MFALLVLCLFALSTCSNCFSISGTPSLAARQSEQVVREFLPELLNFTIQVVPWNTNGAYYMKSSPKMSSLLKNAPQRIYQTFVNPKLYDAGFGPSNASLVAILTHELCHTRDYTRMSLWQLTKFVAKYGTDRNFLIQYEHETDQCVLEIDRQLMYIHELYKGLIEYRLWIYGQLSGQDLLNKRAEYMTPAAIDQWVLDHPAPNE